MTIVLVPTHLHGFCCTMHAHAVLAWRRRLRPCSEIKAFDGFPCGGQRQQRASSTMVVCGEGGRPGGGWLARRCPSPPLQRGCNKFKSNYVHTIAPTVCVLHQRISEYVNAYVRFDTIRSSALARWLRSNRPDLALKPPVGRNGVMR